ncbi:Cro/Cl family transcriptional regulator [Diaphorobacter ruginosibacter]|uniref:Cro/Cl family transcriptional regulator n=1 Tax=Diaphorobacter ruginosibacter TaxID=1715720 RepID=A0A7G9RLM5_9BURK|nr:Cro/Cl family transcriptional regulator [Diaphorobacter ruginosibacter]
MNTAELITFFRTQAVAARALGCAQSTIAEWVAGGAIPDCRQYQVQLATQGVLKADKPALRCLSLYATPLFSRQED